MTASAIIMMIIAMLTIWGGLVAAVINLSKRGTVDETDVRDVEVHRDL